MMANKWLEMAIMKPNYKVFDPLVLVIKAVLHNLSSTARVLPI